MKRHVLLLGLASLAVLGLSVACGGNPPPAATVAPTATPTTTAPGPTATPAPTSGPAPEPTATPAPQAQTPLQIAIPLFEENSSGQSGVAVLTAMGSHTEVVLTATAGISRANHIHTGNCGPTLGGVAHPLTNMDNGSSTTMVEVPLESLLTGGFAINLHNAQTASIYTACGDIPAMNAFVTFPLMEQNGSGQTGTATLIARASELDVVLVATPGISRANHIHSGTCPQVGGVVYGLTNIADGLSVTTLTGVTLDALRTGAYAINLHNAQTASIWTACGNIPAGATASSPAPTPTPMAFMEYEYDDEYY